MSEQAEASQQTEPQLAGNAVQMDMLPEQAATSVEAGQFKRIMEAALLTTQEPLTVVELKKLSDVPLDNKFVEALLEQLAHEYADTGVELSQVSSGWRFGRAPRCRRIWTNSTRRSSRGIHGQ